MDFVEDFTRREGDIFHDQFVLGQPNSPNSKGETNLPRNVEIVRDGVMEGGHFLDPD